jgi:hypothetical protein
VSPGEGAVVNQATDAITFAPHEGSLQYLFIASSPVTEDERFGRPPSGNPVLADQVAILFAGGQGATRVPLNAWPRTLPAGRYWFNVWWTFQRSYETCIVLTPAGTCDPTFAPILTPVFSSRYTAPRSFVIPSVTPIIPQPPVPVARRPVRPAACAGYKSALRINVGVVQRAKSRVRLARTPKARRAARAKLKRATDTRRRLISLRNAACQLV